MEEDAVHLLEAHADGHAGAHLVDVDAPEVGDEPDALVELDDCHQPGTSILAPRVSGDDPRVHGPVTVGLLCLPAPGVTVGTHGARRVAKRLALCAAAYQELVLLHALPE